MVSFGEVQILPFDVTLRKRVPIWTFRGQKIGGASIRNQPSLYEYLGEPRLVRGDPDITGEGDAKAGPSRHSIHSSDRRPIQALQLIRQHDYAGQGAQGCPAWLGG